MPKKQPMPAIAIDAIADLTEDERKIVEKILRPDGRLRASKPSVPKKVEIKRPDRRWPTYELIGEEAIRAGEAAYVWRMVAFQISPEPKHQHMPIMADGDLNGIGDEKQPRQEELDDLVKRIVDSVPATQWHGVTRWGQAMGQLGKPVVRQSGAIVYR